MENNNSQHWSDVKNVKFHHRVKRFYHKNLFRKIYTIAIIGLIGANVFSLFKYYSVADEMQQTVPQEENLSHSVAESEDDNTQEPHPTPLLIGEGNGEAEGEVNEEIPPTIHEEGGLEQPEGQTGDEGETPEDSQQSGVETSQNDDTQSQSEPQVNPEENEVVVTNEISEPEFSLVKTSNVTTLSVKEDTTQWVEGEDFEPLEVKASDGQTVLFTIMDRNLGATTSGTTCSSADTGACGYYYQWGNNYGFANQGTLTDTDTALVDITGEGYGPGKYYKSSTFIKRTTSPYRWDTDNSNETYQQYGNLNLWGGEKVSNPDRDRQGPCPSGYHVPDMLEWKAAREIWCTEKMESTSATCNNGSNFRDDLKLPFAGYRNYYDASVLSQGSYGYYWSSIPYPSNASNSYTLGFNSSYIGPQNTNGRAYGTSVRCFKDSQTTKTLTLSADNGEDDVVYNIRWWEPITKSHKIIPEKEGYKFVGWYNGDEEFNFSDSTFINDSTVLTAKWEKYPWYTYDADGGKFADQSSQNVIKFSKVAVSSELSVGQYGYKKIDGATKMHVELVNVGGCGTPIIYIYNYEKDNSTVGDDYIISGTQATLPSDIVIDGDTVGLVVTAYCGGSRTFNIIGEGEYETSGVVSQPTRDGYTFDGWYIIENEQEIDFDPEADNEIEDKTIYARWKANKYNVIFDTDGGNEINSFEVDYDSVIDADSLPVPTKDCNTFLGWDGLVETMPANDITLKAKWNYTCSRYSGGGGRRSSSATSPSKVHGSADEVLSGANEKDSVNETPMDSSAEPQNNNNTQNSSDEKFELDMEKYDNNYSEEMNKAFQFAYKNGITTQSEIKNANMDGGLTRIEMAKMLSYYAINVLGKTPDYSKGVVNFKDVSDKLDSQYNNGVKLAYYLGIMGQNMKNNKFRPNVYVTRAEFVTALSRLVYGMEDGNGKMKYYEPHMARLYNEGIINDINPNMKERRGYVMLILSRIQDK